MSERASELGPIVLLASSEFAVYMRPECSWLVGAIAVMLFGECLSIDLLRIVQ